VPAYREIAESPLSLDAIISVDRDFHFSKRILLDTVQINKFTSINLL
jgi:hypothetical protein